MEQAWRSSAIWTSNDWASASLLVSSTTPPMTSAGAVSMANFFRVNMGHLQGGGFIYRV
jgi:hypothetical protein